MKRIVVLLLILSSFIAGCNEEDAEPGIYAVINIKHGEELMGEVIVKLYAEQAPVTVENFAGLAKGTKKFVDPSSGQWIQQPFYNGLVFHRVIKGFMIQGGDPTGTGRGGPGYRFRDEIDPALKFSEPGILAMANAGPNTNGSQFFITVAPAPWLNGRHTIFGKVVKGYDIVEKISLVSTDKNDRPLTPVVMDKVKIIEIKGESNEGN